MPFKHMFELRDQGDKAWPSWTEAGSYALSKHAGYVAAISWNHQCEKIYAELEGYATEALAQMKADPKNWDPSWLTTTQDLVNKARERRSVLKKALQDLIQDMATHAPLKLRGDKAKTITYKLRESPYRGAPAAAKALDAASPAQTAAAPVPAPPRGIGWMIAGGAAVIGIIWKMARS